MCISIFVLPSCIYRLAVRCIKSPEMTKISNVRLSLYSILEVPEELFLLFIFIYLSLTQIYTKTIVNICTKFGKICRLGKFVDWFPISDLWTSCQIYTTWTKVCISNLGLILLRFPGKYSGKCPGSQTFRQSCRLWISSSNTLIFLLYWSKLLMTFQTDLVPLISIYHEDLQIVSITELLH